MKSSVLLILSTFSAEELKLFDDFLRSPFHNRNNKVILLYDLLKTYHPDYNNDRLNKENLFKEIYGNEKFRESYVRNLFSDLKILAENFFVHNNILKSRSKSKILIEELSNRDLTNLSNKKLTEFEIEINTAPSKDQDYYSDKLFVYDMKSFMLVDKTLINSFRKDQILSHIKFFLISIMESYFHLIIEEQRVRIKHEYSFLKYILNYVKDHLNEFKNVPLLMIFYSLWTAFLEDDSEAGFRNAGEHFKLNFNKLSQTDKKNIYAVMQLYYDKKIKEGKTKYNKELLNLLLEMLEHNIISHTKKNYIHINLYRNILILCFKLKEISKLKNFVSGYLKFVREDSRSTITAYSKAHLNFLEGNFEAALESCHKINFNDLFMSTNENLYFKIDVKTLILKCFYELNSYESAFSHLHTFRQFLNNSKIIRESSKKMHLQLLKFIFDMLNLKLNFNEYKFITLKNKVIASQSLSGMEWITEKLNELEVNNRK